MTLRSTSPCWSLLILRTVELQVTALKALHSPQRKPLAMADIQHWRRMVQPSRSKLPTISAPEHHEHETVSDPATPRKRPRPKISSYFAHHMHAGGSSKLEIVHSDDPPTSKTLSSLYMAPDPWPDPDADDLVDGVMSRLLAFPYNGLDAQQNGPLLRIMEGYRRLSDEIRRLHTNLKAEVDSRHAAELDMQKAVEKWVQERRDLQAEVKRLERLLVKGKRGLADVVRGRQSSSLRRESEPSGMPEKKLGNDKETVSEFLAQSRRDEENMGQNHGGTYFSRISTGDERLSWYSIRRACCNGVATSGCHLTRSGADFPSTDHSTYLVSFQKNGYIVIQDDVYGLL